MDKFTIRDLNLYYSGFHALKSINLNLPSNEITAFIGPSGCGKSTLLKTLRAMCCWTDRISTIPGWM